MSFLTSTSSAYSETDIQHSQDISKYLTGAIQVDLLSGGAFNRCYRVQTPQETFVMRIGKPHPENYGFDRNKELQFYQIAENLGLSPPLKTSDPSLGILIMKYIDGQLLDQTLIRQEGMLLKVSTLLQKLHSVKCETADQEPATISFINAHLKKLKALKFLPAGWEAIIQHIISQTSFSKQLVLCHNDLAFNLLLEKDRLWAIDWECAGWNDPLFDLAPLCIWYDFSSEERKNLLRAYFGELIYEKELDLAIRLVLIFSSLWSLLEVAYGNDTYLNQALELFAQATTF